MADKNKRENVLPTEVSRLREEHKKMVSGCQDQIRHWNKVECDYEALQERLSSLPDKLSYDIMVPFGSLAFMPGKLVHTNEVTVLLGDNWFAKCSAKQAINLVEHRKKHVKSALDDLYKVVKNFEARVGFTEDLEKLSGGKDDFVDIREEVENEEILTKGKQRTAHKPNSKPKIQDVFEASIDVEENDSKGRSGILSEEKLWARLDELEAQEELMDQQVRVTDNPYTNGEDTASSSSEEEKECQNMNLTSGLHEREAWPPVTQGDSRLITCQVNGTGQPHSDDDEDVGSFVPTIYFLHTVEQKRVRINTGKNTTLKFSERKEEAKRKRKNSTGNGHSLHELPKIKTPADIYRVFVDVVNGELIPRKSILKSRSRENSVCSDTSESSAADFDDRRGFSRSLSHDEATHSDTSESILEEENSPSKPLPMLGVYEAFSGTVVEKDPILPSVIPHLTISPPALPTIPERKCEEIPPEAPQQPSKRVSKFKAARMQQQK